MYSVVKEMVFVRFCQKIYNSRVFTGFVMMVQCFFMVDYVHFD